MGVLEGTILLVVMAVMNKEQNSKDWFDLYFSWQEFLEWSSCE